MSGNVPSRNGAMHFGLSEEQLAYQDAARSFARGEMAPHAARWDETCEFPLQTIARAGEMGFCGLYTPQALGGLGIKVGAGDSVAQWRLENPAAVRQWLASIESPGGSG